MTDTNFTIDENDLVLVTSAAGVVLGTLGDPALAKAMKNISGTLVDAGEVGASVTITPDSNSKTPRSAVVYIDMFERIMGHRDHARAVSTNNDEGEIVYV